MKDVQGRRVVVVNAQHLAEWRTRDVSAESDVNKHDDDFAAIFRGDVKLHAKFDQDGVLDFERKVSGTFVSPTLTLCGVRYVRMMTLLSVAGGKGGQGGGWSSIRLVLEPSSQELHGRQERLEPTEAIQASAPATGARLHRGVVRQQDGRPAGAHQERARR